MVQNINILEREEVTPLLDSLSQGKIAGDITLRINSFPENDDEALFIREEWGRVIKKITELQKKIRPRLLVVASIPSATKRSLGQWKKYHDPLVIDDCSFIRLLGWGHSKEEPLIPTSLLLILSKEEKLILPGEVDEFLASIYSQDEKDGIYFFVPLEQVIQVSISF